MAKKKPFSVSGLIITSSKSAWDAAEKLESILSQESYLTQRILIYVAELLEDQNVLLSKLVKRQLPRRKASFWNRLFKRT